MELVARPIDQWPGPLRASYERQSSNFTADWQDTTALLEREVSHLAGDSVTVVLQLAITERDCRNDGWIRSDARPAHPGAIISFPDRKGTPLRFSTDKFEDNTWGLSKYLRGWKANVRAIALALEALRKVDRYGIGSGGEQYVGWQAIAAESSIALGNGQMTPRDAARALLDAAHLPTDEPSITAFLADRESWARVYRTAAGNMHPDRPTGSEAAFKLVSEAKAVLDTL